jgi:hypothetical protein
MQSGHAELGDARHAEPADEAAGIAEVIGTGDGPAADNEPATGVGLIVGVGDPSCAGAMLGTVLTAGFEYAAIFGVMPGGLLMTGFALAVVGLFDGFAMKP